MSQHKQLDSLLFIAKLVDPDDIENLTLMDKYQQGKKATKARKNKTAEPCPHVPKITMHKQVLVDFQN